MRPTWDAKVVVIRQQSRTPTRVRRISGAASLVPRAEMSPHALKYGIGIAGTHGKTSTTSMVGTILMAANLDPTIIVGGKVGDWAAMPNWVRANFRG